MIITPLCAALKTPHVRYVIRLLHQTELDVPAMIPKGRDIQEETHEHADTYDRAYRVIVSARSHGVVTNSHDITHKYMDANIITV